MAKDDAPRPATVPTKRRVLQDPAQTLDRWLASWAADESLPPSQRVRAQEERDRRKALSPTRSLGLVVAQEGMTPEQYAALPKLLDQLQPTEIHHPGAASKVHQACRAVATVHVHRDVRDHHAGCALVVRAADIVIAAPKERRMPQDHQRSVWSFIRMAKHRSVPVHVIMPDGQILQEDA
jgi:hypothetical protein